MTKTLKFPRLSSFSMATTTFISSPAFPRLSSFSPVSSSRGRQSLHNARKLRQRKLNDEIKRPPKVFKDNGCGRFLKNSGGNYQSVNSCLIFLLSSALFISSFSSLLFFFISSFPSFPRLSSFSPVSSRGCQRLHKRKLNDEIKRPPKVLNDNGRFLKNSGGNYRSLDSCIIFPPPAGRKPIAIVMFLGGAFIGAIPEVTYGYLIESLAKEGFLVVAVPYTVTFDHERAAREVYERFRLCMDSLTTSGAHDISPSHLASIPLYSVGHSNGALYQMLIGSYFAEKIPKANVVISFNNRPASQAVPLIDQLGPKISKIMLIVEASPVCSIVQYFSGIACEWLLKITSTIIQDYDQGSVALLTKFFAQVYSVMKEVIRGTSEFKPTPAENRECIKKSYNVPHTLLVKFSTDALDESDLPEEILKHRVKSTGGTQEKIILSGHHLTPCMQADTLARELKSLPPNDTELFVKTIADWLKDIDHK